ncbi:PrgI family protein [Patescibacteria group bacterium]|nr:PrgI family protein [Patescibacteria group bacterium]MCL5797191.1 PrgI family protein [Patescibacteria group bacterium]
MEQHPVPRNISGFQFHLIGDMTLRQFGYLAVGIGGAYFIFKLAPFPSIISFPLAGIVGLAGFAFAFLPIQERPLDKWLVAFIKSVTSPTQYLWIKNNPPPDVLTRPIVIGQRVISQSTPHIVAHREAQQKLASYLASLPQSPHETLNLREKKYINSTLSLFQTSGVYIGNNPTTYVASKPSYAQHVEPLRYTPLSKQSTPINASFTSHVVKSPQTDAATQPKSDKVAAGFKQITISQPSNIKSNTQITSTPTIHDAPTQQATEKNATQKNVQQQTKKPAILPSNLKPITQSINPPTSQKSIAQADKVKDQNIPETQNETNSLQKQLTDLAAEKKRLEDELNKLKNERVNLEKPEIVKPVAMEEKPSKEPTIKTIPAKSVALEMGITNINQNPNIIAGVFKDPQHKILPNIILTIKDKNNNPLRAMKTNKLGQFATATPLPNGVYLLEAEDPLKRYVFDIAEITLAGKVFSPVEIIAKGEKELMREKLNKAVFGNATI